MIFLVHSLSYVYAAPFPEDLRFLNDGYLVRLSGDFSAEAVLMEEGGQHFRADEGDREVTEEILLIHDEKTVRSLLSDGTAVYAEPNWEVELLDTGVLGQADDEGSITESGFHGWAYEAMRVDAARKLGLTGKGIRIGMIDSGVDRDDPDLQDAIVLEGYNYINHTTEVTDEVGHGTRVARMIAGDDDGQGVTGVAPGVELVPLQCFSTAKTHVADLIRPIREAVDQYHCDIINMSWGLKSLNAENSSLLQEAVEYAWNQGVVMVAAAGNVSSSYPAGSVLYPAAYEQVIGVGAVDQDLRNAPYSQQTDAVDVTAPGTGVIDGMNGTSFACPCVSGVVALLLQEDPVLTPEEVTQKLREYALDLGDEGYDISYGWGFVQMDRLLGHIVISLNYLKQTEEALSAEKKICIQWHNPQTGQTAWLAMYDERGRMLGIQMISLMDKQFLKLQEAKQSEGDRRVRKVYEVSIPVMFQVVFIKLILLDEKGMPAEKDLQRTVRWSDTRQSAALRRVFCAAQCGV